MGRIRTGTSGLVRPHVQPRSGQLEVAPGDLVDLDGDDVELRGVDPGPQGKLVGGVGLLPLELPGPAADDDTARLALGVLVDLEGHVGVHRETEELAALRGPEDESALAVDGVV